MASLQGKVAIVTGASSGIGLAVSKALLKEGCSVGATKNTAWLFKDDGIRCNAICPGGVATNIAKNIDRTKWDLTALSRMKPVIEVHANLQTGEGIASPDLCADVLVFLALDLSRGVTGAIIPVDNAWSTI